MYTYHRKICSRRLWWILLYSNFQVLIQMNQFNKDHCYAHFLGAILKYLHDIKHWVETWGNHWYAHSLPASVSKGGLEGQQGNIGKPNLNRVFEEQERPEGPFLRGILLHNTFDSKTKGLPATFELKIISEAPDTSDIPANGQDLDFPQKPCMIAPPNLWPRLLC